MTQPNFIVFFTDQQRWDTTGVHGNPLSLTPNFDRFARSGTHCYNAFTPQPVCGPARSVMQTGQYATTSGCYRNGIPLPSNAKTLAHYFNEAGYKTGYIGKWHLAEDEPVPADQRGEYDYWLASNLLEFTSDAYDLNLYDNSDQSVKLPGYRVDAQTDAAVRFIDSQQANPFFLFLSYLEPHHQNHTDDYPAPDGYRERYTGRWTPPDLAALGGSSQQHLGGYYGMVKRLDEAFGRIQDALKSLGLAKNTIILFTSDHGCHFKTRNDEYKRSGHDSSIRVPMAWSGGPFTSGGQLQDMISLIDIPPTLLDAASIPVPAQMQGRSILPLLKKDRETWPTEHFAQISESQVARTVRTQRWKYIVDAPEMDAWDDMGSDTYTEQALYDLQADPYELTNLIGIESHRAVCDRMAMRLKARMVEAGEAEPKIVEAAQIPAGQRSVTEAEVNM
ncbi:MAG: sulfatase-like hydrolase/transferase [Anaerolineae bacterium]